MGIKDRIPKLTKKHLIGVAALVGVAALAFVLGTVKAAKNAPLATEQARVHPAHDPDEGHPKAPSRAPASAPGSTPSPGHEDEDYYEELEEVDTLVAQKLPKTHSKVAPTKENPKKENPAPVETHAASSAVHVQKDERGLFRKIVDAYLEAWTSIQTKVQAIKRLEEENKNLRLENAHLRVMVETGRYLVRSEEAKKKTETVGKKLATEAGSKAARSLASIRYQYPENLLPEQLHALGVSYFKARDDEKAAVIFNFLTHLEDDRSYQNASTYLMAGISFYRLDHYKNASEYFDKIDKLTETDEVTIKAKRQANYWRALVAEKTKNRGLAQKLILKGLESNPHTQEARWVNPQAEPSTGRLPASVNGKHPPKKENRHEGTHSESH